MRKNTARHWLHAVLDLLPVLLIPVFMIYSHRHDITQQTEVDIQYKYQSNEVNSVDDLIEGNIYKLNLENKKIEDLIQSGYIIFDLLSDLDFTLFDLQVESTSNEFITIGADTLIVMEDQDDPPQYIYTYYNYSQYEDYSYTNLYYFSSTFNSNCYIKFIEYSGTLNYLLFEESNYNEIESVDVHDETSSVMNVFVDNFNNAINKYFNMGNVFNMTSVYNWFNTNIFGGTAPVVIYSVWNIVLYEFVMDLLFLLYGLFMFFIDMCKRLIEKPLESIK